MTQAVLAASYKPQEVVADARPARLGQVCLALACVVLFLFLFTSSALKRCAEDLDVNAANDLIVIALSNWDHWMHQAGLAMPFDMLRDAFEWFRSLA